MGTHDEIHNDNVIKATMEELADDERQAYLIAEEHLKEQFLQGFKKECGGLFKSVFLILQVVPELSTPLIADLTILE